MEETMTNFEKWDVYAMDDDGMSRRIVTLTIKAILGKKAKFIEFYKYSPEVVVLSKCWEGFVKAWSKGDVVVAGLKVIFTRKPNTVEVY